MSTNGGKQPSSPGPSSPSQCRTTETNQIITGTKSHFKQLFLRKQYLNKQKTRWTFIHMHGHPQGRQAVRMPRGQRGPSMKWGQHLGGECTVPPHDTHTSMSAHTSDRDTWLPAAQHNGLFPWLLQPGDLYITATFGRRCAGHLSILITGRHLPPRPGHTPFSTIKQSLLRGRSRVCSPSGDSIAQHSFTFPRRLKLSQVGCTAVNPIGTAFLSFALFSHSLTAVRCIVCLILFDRVVAGWTVPRGPVQKLHLSPWST